MTSSTERVRRMRDRRAAGVCCVTIGVGRDQLEALAELGWLPGERLGDAEAERQAVESFLAVMPERLLQARRSGVPVTAREPGPEAAACNGVTAPARAA